METVRQILASHESGISRDGLLAWARLRGDPQMTDAQLEAALAEMGDQVIDVQGFLYLREHAPASALGTTAGSADPASVMPPAWTSADPDPRAPAGGAGASPGGPPADPRAAPPAGQWLSPDGQVVTPAPGGAGADGWPAPGGEGWPAPGGAWPASPPSSSRRTMVVATVGVVAFLVAAGIGVFLLRDADTGGADATPAQPTPTSGLVVGASSLAAGDCLILPSEDQFDDVRRLDCTEPHDGEVVFVGAHPGSSYPPEEDFSSYVEAQCLPAFAEYTGSDYESQEVLEVGWFTPTERAWDDGDREVTCYLTPVDGARTSQSYRGAKP